MSRTLASGIVFFVMIMALPISSFEKVRSSQFPKSGTTTDSRIACITLTSH